MRYLALDLGGKRIGVAVGGDDSGLARPLTILKRRSRAEDFSRIAALAAQEGAEALVVGLPLNMDGSRGPQALWAERYAQALAEHLDLPLHLWDERLTSEEAEAILAASGRRRRGEPLDDVAAAVILQDFLDARRLSGAKPENFMEHKER